MKFRSCMMLWLALTAVTISLPVLADRGEKLIVGIEDINYPPYYYKSDQGSLTGFSIDLLEAFFKDQDLAFQYQPLPVKRLAVALVTGGVDFKYPDSPSWSFNLKQEHDVTYSETTVEAIDGSFTLHQQDLELDSLKTIGFILGFSPIPYLSRIDSGQLKVIGAHNMDQLYELLRHNRVQAIYVNTLTAKKLYSKNNNGPLMWNRKLPFIKSAYRLSTTKHPGLIKRFDAFMIKNASLIVFLKEKYGIELNEPASDL